MNPILGIILVGCLFISGIIISYFVKNKELFSKKDTTMNTNTLQTVSVVSKDHIMKLHDLYNKTLIGISNEQFEQLIVEPNIQKRLSDIISEDEYGIIGDIYPADLQEDLKDSMRGRTILILVEIAYQPKSKSKTTYLADILGINKSTMSKELNRLLDMEYITLFMDDESLKDNRHKFYKLTQKGLIFLHLLKESLQIVIINMKKNNLLNNT